MFSLILLISIALSPTPYDGTTPYDGAIPYNGAVEHTVYRTEVYRSDTSVYNEAYLKRLEAIRKATDSLARAGARQWVYRGGAWTGIHRERRDMVEVNAGSSGDAGLSKDEVDSKVKQIESHPEIRKILDALKWDPADYVKTVHPLIDAATLYSIEQAWGKKQRDEWAKTLRITYRPEAFEFVRANRERLLKVGFVGLRESEEVEEDDGGGAAGAGGSGDDGGAFGGAGPRM